jgi:DNA-binding transcriptional LysR family regulator
MLPEQQIEALNERRIHLGISRDMDGGLGLMLDVLLKERLVAVLPRKHRLASQATIDLAQLADDPFVLFPEALSERYPRMVLSLCTAAGFVPRIAYQVHEIHTAIGLVAAGLGVTLVGASVARHQQDDLRFCILRTGEVPPITVLQALYRPDEPLPFLQSMREILRSVGAKFETPYPL